MFAWLTLSGDIVISHIHHSADMLFKKDGFKEPKAETNRNNSCSISNEPYCFSWLLPPNTVKFHCLFVNF